MPENKKEIESYKARIKFSILDFQKTVVGSENIIYLSKKLEDPKEGFFRTPEDFRLTPGAEFPSEAEVEVLGWCCVEYDF